MVVYSNLRDPKHSLFRDTKHIHQDGIPKFASNLKNGLCAAYGVRRWGRSNIEQGNKNSTYKSKNIGPTYDKRQDRP